MRDCKHICSALILGLVITFVFNVQVQAVVCDGNLPEYGSRDDILIIVNDNSLDSCEVGLLNCIQK